MEGSWIVDSSNVMGARPDGWWRDRPLALARLLDEIARWHDVTGNSTLVVADGFPSARVPEGTLYGVEVRYAHSRARDAADDEIVRRLHAEPAIVGPRVVTSDRELRRRVTALGASVEGAKAFLDRIADIEPRRRDRAVLAAFGIDESTLVGRGGEARVFQLDDERVLRLPHPDTDRAALDERRQMLDAIGTADGPMATPEVLEHREVEGRTVVVERRLPGHNAMEVLATDGTDRVGLVRDHLDRCLQIPDLPCPVDRFGELWGVGAIVAGSFSKWSRRRLAESLRIGGEAVAHVDPEQLTRDLIDVLPDPEPGRPVLVHMDAFLGNMLADRSQITALLDFGPMSIGGPPHLDALLAVAYLATDITPTAVDSDRAAAHAWADEHGLGEALAPAERWIAAYWTGAPDDQRLWRWCTEILR